MPLEGSACRSVSILYFLTVILAPCSSPAGPQDKLTASDGERSDAFGWSVAVSGDTALFGAIGGLLTPGRWAS